MTAEEVTVVHVAEEEVVASSSSKVDIVGVGKEEKQMEDLSNVANGRIVKEDTDGDGDGDGYVFVNGNDVGNGDPAELDIEKNSNDIGREDRGVEDWESKGELESESDLVKDLEGEDESCNGIADQDNELCHVEAPVDEQKTESDPVAKLTVSVVSGDSCATQEVISYSKGSTSKENDDNEMVVADDVGCNGNGLANDGIVVDSRSKENEDSAVADGIGCNGNGLANDNIEVTVLDSSTKDIEGGIVVDSTNDILENPEIVVADDISCNGDSLANDNTEDVFVSKEKDDSVFDGVVCNVNGSTNDSIEDTVVNSISKENEDSVEETVVSSSSKENEDSEVAVADDVVCNGNGLANGSIEDTVVHSRSKENESGMDVLADGGDRNADVKETVSEGVFDTSNEDARVSSVSGKPNVREEDSVSEAVLVDKHNGVPVSISDDSNGDNLPVDAENTDDALDVSNDSNWDGLSVDAENTEQNGYLVKPDNVTDAASGNETVLADAASGYETVLADEASGNETADAASGNEMVLVDAAPGNETVLADAASGNETLLVDAASGNETVLADAAAGNETVLADAASGNETVLADAASGNETVLPDAASGNETVLPDAASGNETVLPDAPSGNETVLPDAPSGNETVLPDAPSGNESVNETPVEVVDSHLDERVQDSKLEADVIKSDENNRSSDSCDVENSRVDVVESSSVAHDSDSSCLANGLKSVTENPSDSIVSEVVEVSKGFTVSDSLEPDAVDDIDKNVAVADIQNNSNLAAPLSNDEKAPDSVENLSNCDTNDNEVTCPVIKEGIQFGSVFASEEPEGLHEIRKSPFYYLIRVPRYDDENLKEKIRLAQIRVDEKTQSRDAIRIEMQSQKAILKEFQNEFDAAVSQERAARELIKSKRMEIESIQSMMNIEDIGTKIRNMEHMIQHETLPLKDEKQFIREINQLKQTRDRLNKGKKDEVQEGVDHKVQIEERLKSLKKEIDQLRVNLMKAEAVTKAAKKKLQDESDKSSKLVAQFKAADGIRQEAYVQLQSLKKESYEKNKYFWQYRDDSKKAYELGSKGDKEAVRNLCVEQDKKLRDLWSNSDEFRKEYVRCNVRSTLWRLKTLDGRKLGPDEEPPVIPQVVSVMAKDRTVSSSTLKEQTQEKVALSEAEKPNDKPVATAVEQKKHTSKSEKSLKSVPQATGPTSASIEDKIEEAVEEKPKRTKEEEEAARKAEELRKEEEAAKLREQRRLEEKAKAKEAVLRKRRIAEKAQARAALRAQKEAEEKEKEREKRAKKKERRKGSATSVGDASVTEEIEFAPTSETPAETSKEPEKKEKPATTAKRSQKPSQFTKQTKAKSSIPPPLRNRGKKRMQAWMWVLLTALVIFALFLIGNYNFSSNFGRQSFNF